MIANEPHAQVLRSAGLKPTHGRIRVLALAGQVGVMTPEMAIHRLPDVGLGSVYRILSELCAAGLLARCTVCLGRQAYAIVGSVPRIVLHCLQCGQTQGVDASDIVVQFEQLAAREGYLFDRAVLGTSTCARCAAQALDAPQKPPTSALLP